MKFKHPEHVDVLQAIYELYVQKGNPEKTIFTPVIREVADILRKRGFTISNTLVWQRMYEHNKTIEITETEDTLPGTSLNYEQVIKVHWFCQHDVEAMKDWKEKEKPLMFQMGTVTNEIAGLVRKRKLEEEQLRFWFIATLAALATLGNFVLQIGSCIVNYWNSVPKP